MTTQQDSKPAGLDAKIAYVERAERVAYKDLVDARTKVAQAEAKLAEAKEARASAASRYQCTRHRAHVKATS